MSGTRANAILLNMSVLLGLLIHTSWAANYTVGDSKGWTFNVAGWENGKKFKVGDILIFNYPSTLHSVVAVSKSDYDTCTVNGKKFSSGKDKIKLAKGNNYFICGTPGHCGLGMKIAANAS